MKKQEQNLLYILDAFSHRDIKRWKRQHDLLVDYCWDHYSYLAHKRSQISEQLQQSLLQNCKQYSFNKWCRAMDFRFSNEPLSARGSIHSGTGGRFNIGDIDPLKFPKFAGLYLADTAETAIREKCGIDPEENQQGLTGTQLNLLGNMAIVNVKGNITNLLDLTEPESLEDFFVQISTIALPLQFIGRANKLKINAMIPVRNVNELRNTFFTEQWRVMPMQFDIPANPQIFGQLAYTAGIEGILYPSIRTNGKCLVVYPNNFSNSESYIEIDGETPESVINKRIDKSTYNNYI